MKKLTGLKSFTTLARCVNGLSGNTFQILKWHSVKNPREVLSPHWKVQMVTANRSTFTLKF